MVNSTAIDSTVIDDDGVYRHTGPALFCSEESASAAVKSEGDDRICKGDIWC